MRLVSNCQGLTLFEILITLVIFFILFCIGFPNLQSWFARNRLQAIAAEVQTAIDTARSSAIRAQANVIYCGSSDHATCDGNWNAGQVLRMQDTDQILHVWPALSTSESLQWQSSLGKNAGLVFTADGFTYGQDGNFLLCAKKMSEGLALIVTFSGRVRVESREC